MKQFLFDCYDILRRKDGLPRRELVWDYLRMRAAGLAPSQGSEVPIFGYSFSAASPDMALHLYREIFISQVYRFTLNTSRPLIIDCGSNVGMSLLYFKKIAPDSEVIAVEPDPAAFRMLQKNAEQNGWKDVTLCNKAISSRDGEISFYVNENNPGDLGMSTIAQGHLPKEIVVPCVRLSALVGDREVDFLKLDIEGVETEVIDEMAGCGALRQIKEMVIEYHHHIAGRPDCLSHMLATLEKNGFGYQMSCLDLNFRSADGFQVVWIYGYRRDGVGCRAGQSDRTVSQTND